MRLNWEKLLSNKRVSELGSCKQDSLSKSVYSEPRSPYERDFDQIIFSYPFRRLQDKTQVIPFPKFDFVHTRLTHSLEVASIGRSFGKMASNLILEELGEEKIRELNICPSDIGALVAASCLAHDIGNPPFGHSGEDAISYYFKYEEQGNIRPWIYSDHKQINEDRTFTFRYHDGDIETFTAKEIFDQTKKWNDLTNFEGNANGLRILTMNCDKGINPTSALLGVFSKYPRESYLINDPYVSVEKKDKPINLQKYGFFQEQREIFKEVADELGLLRIPGIHKDDLAYCRHPLAYLMEAADDIAYRMIDFEDGIRLELIDFDKDYKLYKTRKGKKEKNKDEIISISPEQILKDIASIDSNFNYSEIESKSAKDRLVYLRGIVINTLIHETFKIFKENYEEIMKGKFEFSLLDKVGDIRISQNLFLMRSLIELKVYNYVPVLENEAAGFDVLGSLINDFAITTNICISCGDEETAKQKKIRSLIPEEYQPEEEIVNQVVDFNEKYKRVLLILDFVSGMTDGYAIDKYKKIHGIEISN